ncbi:MAG: carbon storage regulator CsrA [Dehalococcoidia bacterium]|nr:carbon storage regulator CsrA [Dehalococcoidia bacterium]
MLILTRKVEQGIVIDGDIVVRVLAVDGERVKLGIEAPKTVPVLREELLQEVAGQNREAVELARHASVVDSIRRIGRDPVRD